MLYATLRSGINTYFSSRDFMRQHKFSLPDDKARKIFRQWQMTRQVYPVFGYHSHYQRNVILVYPPSYVPIAQKHKNGWHIPYNEELVGKEVQISSRPKTWICLCRKVKQK